MIAPQTLKFCFRSEMDYLHEGYHSDNASFRYSETSRESSPHKSLPVESSPYKTLPAKPPQPISSSTPKWQQETEEAYLKAQAQQQMLQRYINMTGWDQFSIEH